MGHPNMTPYGDIQLGTSRRVALGGDTPVESTKELTNEE
jgi:hypothetical protein